MTEVRKQIDRRQQEQTTTATSTTYHTEPGVHDPGALERIRVAYEGVLGDLNAIKARDIEQALDFIEPSAVIDAIEQTGYAARPTHYYFAAILRRYMNEGIRTEKDAQRDRYIRREKQREEKWRRDDWFTHDSQELWF